VKGLEVPVFVEDVVGGEQRLSKPLIHAPLPQEHRAVEERPALVGRVRLGQADEDGRQISRLARQRLQRVPASTHECRIEQQVAGQVADEGELRRDREIGAPGARLPQRIGNQPRVAGEIADRWVDLQQRNLHRDLVIWSSGYLVI
jgi:hypothetical protein